jgi:hypothetical protein
MGRARYEPPAGQTPVERVEAMRYGQTASSLATARDSDAIGHE